MATPRGKSGSVRGTPAKVVTDILVNLVRLLDERTENRLFVRHQAIELLRTEWELEEPILSGFMLALERMPGVEKVGGGVYRLPPHPEVWARNRDWRFNVGRLDLEAARDLHALFQFGFDHDQVPKSLHHHAERLDRILSTVLTDWSPLVWPPEEAPHGDD